MAKKQQDQLKAKQKRQKVMAIGGAVVLLGVLAIQVPRTMKMLNAQAPPPPPPAAVPTAVPTDPSVLPTPGTVGGGAAPTASGGGTLVDSDPPPAPANGQLIAFGRFSSKDPFHQQIDERVTASSGGTGGAAAPPQPGPGAAPGSTPGAGGVVGSPSGPTPAPSAPGGPSTPGVAASAVIAVNGIEETVAKGESFPKDAPVFTLVSIGKAEVKIAIAGGALASGARSVPLAKGKTLTLVNTADGTRYELKLVALGG